MPLEIKANALYRPSDLVEILNLNRRTIQKMLKAGTLPGFKIGRRRWYVRGDDLLNMGQAGNDRDAAADDPGAERRQER